MMQRRSLPGDQAGASLVACFWSAAINIWAC
jgi:hypothetical protein